MLGYWKSASTVIRARVKDTFVDPHPIDRFPALGGQKTRYAYAEIEVLETLKGSIPSPYIARLAEGECFAEGPFKIGETGLFKVFDKPFDGPAVFRGHKQVQAAHPTPTIRYSFATGWPASFGTEEALEFFRGQSK